MAVVEMAVRLEKIEGSYVSCDMANEVAAQAWGSRTLKPRRALDFSNERRD